MFLYAFYVLLLVLHIYTLQLHYISWTMLSSSLVVIMSWITVKQRLHGAVTRVVYYFISEGITTITFSNIFVGSVFLLLSFTGSGFTFLHLNA